MTKWLFMLVPLYLSYYTAMYVAVVWKKERNLLACVCISALALSLTAIPIWLRLRR